MPGVPRRRHMPGSLSAELSSIRTAPTARAPVPLCSDFCNSRCPACFSLHRPQHFASFHLFLWTADSSIAVMASRRNAQSTSAEISLAHLKNCFVNLPASLVSLLVNVNTVRHWSSSTLCARDPDISFSSLSKMWSSN